MDKIRVASGVLVQGPPGTGKSHTIANLICHLLATGQRTLITAKTPRALQVLEGLVPRELRPLCINLLGSGLEEKRSLESSVGGILRKNEEWNESRATKERENLEQKLRKLREEKVNVDRRLRDIRESETHSQSIAEGTYRGTAARIAEAVNRDRPAYGWFTDKAPLEKTCPISESDLRNVLAALRRFTPEKRRDLSLLCPDVLPSPDRLLYLVEREKRAIEEEQGSAKQADGQIADHLSKIDVATIKAIREALSAFQCERRRYSASPHPWMRDALRDVIGGNPSLWQELSRVTRDVIVSIESLVVIADDISLDFPDNTNVRSLLEDVCKLKEHVQNGGKLGWGPFRPKIVKERIHVLKKIQVNGHSYSNLEHLSVLADALRVRLECEKAWGFWVGRTEKTQGPYVLQLSALKAQCDALECVLSLDGLIGKCRAALQHCPALDEPVWGDESQIERLIASCILALARHGKRLVVGEIRDIETPLEAIVARTNPHPKTSELFKSIRNRDAEGFTRVRNELMDLERERQSVQKVDEDIEKLNQIVPRLTEELKYTCNNSCWDVRFNRFKAPGIGHRQSYGSKNTFEKKMHQALRSVRSRLRMRSIQPLRNLHRCMPEIIRFSNDLCYSDTPLIPLRQYGPDRLTPLKHVFVSGGYREGSNNRAVNRPEADAIVEKIAGLCGDEEYSGKTMGVVVLQGEAQAGLIEGQLLERLGAEEMERRRLVCGNPYSFQGDERHIIFLSMVAATNERIGPFTRPADERRFNVAASRARDQMYLFHSVGSEDLSASCLRRGLLEFFENTKPQEIAGTNRDELERRALLDNRSVVNPPLPFESWFEVDIALELVRKGFNVLPQYEIAGKRIDLVVEGGNARLAVECDGDEWHGADRYEADMQRQRQLERCGWEFFRVRESAFYSNKEGALHGLWQMLEERNISPGVSGDNQGPEFDEDEKDNDEYDCDEAADDEEERDAFSQAAGAPESTDIHSGQRAEKVAMSEIQEAILQALSKCPNQSCTIHSMTSRVLKELGVLTRGNPRKEFEKFVRGDGCNEGKGERWGIIIQVNLKLECCGNRDNIPGENPEGCRSNLLVVLLLRLYPGTDMGEIDDDASRNETGSSKQM